VRNTFALYYFLKNHPTKSFRQMIPKNIRYVDSDEEVESDEEEREEEKERS
jgi:hypothetical protein